MKFSLWPNAGVPAHEILSAARQADEAGWFGVWVADHYMPNTGDTSFRPGDTHEAWGLLPAMAPPTHTRPVGTHQ